MVKGSVVLDEDQLNSFRTKLCHMYSQNKSCPHKFDCMYTHCRTWTRRNPHLFKYSATLCPDLEFEKNENKRINLRSCKCIKGRFCENAHTMEEQMYHPSIYKTSICRSYPNCSKKYCPFAHGSEELREKPNRASAMMKAIGKSVENNERITRGISLAPSLTRNKRRIEAEMPILPPPKDDFELCANFSSAAMGIPTPTSSSIGAFSSDQLLFPQATNTNTMNTVIPLPPGYDAHSPYHSTFGLLPPPIYPTIPCMPQEYMPSAIPAFASTRANHPPGNEFETAFEY